MRTSTKSPESEKERVRPARTFMPPEREGKRRGDLGLPYASLALALLSVCVTAYLALRLGSLTVAQSDQAKLKAQSTKLSTMEARLKTLEALRAQLEPAFEARRQLASAEQELAAMQKTQSDFEAALDRANQQVKAAKGKAAKDSARAEFNRVKAEAAKAFEEIGERPDTLTATIEQAKVAIAERFVQAIPPESEAKPAETKSAVVPVGTAKPVERKEQEAGGKSVEP